jgi:hypothetical protein
MEEKIMIKNHPAMVTTVATINNQQIIVIENGEKRVAVKPICEALGVSIQGQLERLKSDPILSSTIKTSLTVGADGKQREMVTIPFKYVFGWLFLIDSRNVKEEARELVLKYQMQCYDALYKHFTELDDYMKYRQQLAESVWDKVEEAREDFKQTKNRLENLKVQFAEARALTFEQYRQIVKQMPIEFPSEAETAKG